MSPERIKTSRLLLCVEQPSAAPLVLAMYVRNRLCFERFEPSRPKDFYTLEYHQKSLQREYMAYKAGHFLRYYLYDLLNPDQIIGSVNFNFYSSASINYCEIGYKLDVHYQNKGLAAEACREAMRSVQREYGIYRFDARIHPMNLASVRLAQKLGLLPYRFEPKSAAVDGKIVDIMRYSVITSTIQ